MGEELEPSEWFKNKWVEWNKLMRVWRARQSDQTKRTKVPADRRKNDNSVGEADDRALNAEVEGDFDIFKVADVCDVGGGVPLCGEFTFEDWTLAGLRFELHLLVHAFRRDVNDPERTGIPEEHLGFYYKKYYKKNLNLKLFGCKDQRELLALVKDTVTIGPKTGVIESQLSDDMEHLDLFVKLTEENRRERQRRVDAGDESASLKFASQSSYIQAKGTCKAPISSVTGAHQAHHAGLHQPPNRSFSARAPMPWRGFRMEV